jgi:HEAT repeat protein
MSQSIARWGLALVLAAAVVGPTAPTTARPASELWPLIENHRWEELRSRGRGVLPELVALYRATPEPEERLKVARVFYGLGWPSEEARQALTADARTPHEGLRIEVQWALGRVSADDQVVDLLLATLESGGESRLVRDKAACALASDQIHLTDEQRVRLFARVIELLESPEPWLRWTAVRVLEVQTGQHKGFKPQAPEAERAAAVERWKRWLEEYRAQL